MRHILSALVISAFAAAAALGSECATRAIEVNPDLSEEARQLHSRNLSIAARNHAESPSVENVMWYARRKGYLGYYKDAVDELTIAMSKFPKDARMYRHRGHRLITLRCFDDAIKDFEAAVRLINGKDDEVEPDGLPNALNIPTSTLHFNIWYHLGLSYYLKGDLKNALRAYREAERVSKNTDMLAATSHWLYMTLRRLGRNSEAEKVLRPIDANFDVIENDDYLKLLRLYRGEVKANMLLDAIGNKADTLGSASLAYGLGNWYLYNGEKEKAFEIFRKITAGDQWASFGYIAAEAELKRK
jgi:hypothetical protein